MPERMPRAVWWRAPATHPHSRPLRFHRSMGYGNRWSWVKDDTTPAAEVSILVLDARDQEFKVQLTDIQWKQWWLIHRLLPAPILKEMVMPARFSGLEIAKATNRDLRRSSAIP